MHFVSDVTAADGCTKDYCPSNACVNEIDSRVEDVFFATRVVESVRKQSTFPVRLVQPNGSGKTSVVR